MEWGRGGLTLLVESHEGLGNGLTNGYNSTKR